MTDNSEDKLYIITVEDFTLRDKITECFKIFKDLESAEKHMRIIINSFTNYKYRPYQIKVYKFNGVNYELTNETYNYS